MKNMTSKNHRQIRTSLSTVILILGIATSCVMSKDNVYLGIFSSVIILSLVIIANILYNIRVESNRCSTQAYTYANFDSTSISHQDTNWNREKIFDKDFSKNFKKECEEAEAIETDKLEKLLGYTRRTFIPLQFSEEDVLFICQQVEHFVRYGTIDASVQHLIEKKRNVTQTALKNFSWNIAYQYGIGRKETTFFVMTVFHSWFTNSEPSSIYKTLKTTTGAHAIEIDTNII